MKEFTLVIKFIAKLQDVAAFKQVLITLFERIAEEDEFINATLHEALDKPNEFLVYETWNDNIEHFMSVQMKKPYVIVFEKTLEDMGVVREPAAFVAFAQFTATR